MIAIYSLQCIPKSMATAANESPFVLRALVVNVYDIEDTVLFLSELYIFNICCLVLPF